MKKYIVTVRIKLNDCEVGTAKVFVRNSNEKFASDVVSDFFAGKYECEIIEVKEYKQPNKVKPQSKKVQITMYEFSKTQLTSFIERFSKDEKKREILKAKIIENLYEDDLQMIYGQLYGQYGTRSLKNINKLYSQFENWLEKEMEKDTKI